MLESHLDEPHFYHPGNSFGKFWRALQFPLGAGERVLPVK